MSKSQYSLSFTTGASLFRESLALAELKKDIDDWKTVKSKAIEENILQARTESTSRKLCGEVIRRLKHLSTEEAAKSPQILDQTADVT